MKLVILLKEYQAAPILSESFLMDKHIQK